MRRACAQYLGSHELQRRVAAFWSLGRPVGAICHGVLVLARATDPATGRSVLAGRRTTCLPKYMERRRRPGHRLAAGPVLPDLRNPPTNEPAMPSTMVPKIPIGSRPGMSRRAIAPTMSPTIS